MFQRGHYYRLIEFCYSLWKMLKKASQLLDFVFYVQVIEVGDFTE